MKLHYTIWAAAVLVAQSPVTADAQNGGYLEKDLVVNRQIAGVPALVDSNGITHLAQFTDTNLVNPWGIAESATSAFWIANGGAGVSALYNTAGAPQPLVVSIPLPGDPLGAVGIPTGAVFNNLPSALGAFRVSGVNSAGVPVSAPAVFLFATKNGTIVGWNPGVNPLGFDPAKAGKYAITVVDRSNAGAYTGLAIATDSDGVTRLYAANFGAGAVDVFDTEFHQLTSATAFVDLDLPRGFAPFNVVPVRVQGTTQMFVTYAFQDLSKLFSQGRGIVNSFRLDGSAPRRFAQHGALSAPWAVVVVPQEFGELGGALWIGNFGDGRINAYDPVSGRYIDKVRGADRQAIVIDGLWSLKFGNGGNGGATNTLYFTAGPNGELDGLFGSLDPK